MPSDLDPVIGEKPHATERDRALVGTTVDDRYHFDDVIATGAMGTVYLARHLKLKKRVAIKVLHPDVDDHPELVLRFEREALAGAQVAHPHVACATDFGDLEGGARYLVMEYVKGETLRDVLDREAPLEPKRAVAIARQLAVALDHVHSRGIVHRDLKPRNVILGEGDVVKLVDFGLAKIDGGRMSTLPADEAEEDSRLTTRGIIFGTVEYLAPEAAFGMELIDHRADLYALGVILYEMLTGKHPFDAKTEAELFAKQRHAPPPKMKARNPDIAVSDELESLVQKLLHKDFDERHQSASEVEQALSTVPLTSKPKSEREPVAVAVAAPPKAKASQTAKAASTAQPSKPKPKPASSKAAPPKSDPSPQQKEDSSARILGLWALAGIAAAILIGYLLTKKDEPLPKGPATAAPTATPRPTIKAAPAPTPRPTVSTVPAPTATASAATPPVDPEKVREILGRLRSSYVAGEWSNAADDVLALLAADKNVLRDASASGAVSEMLMALDKEKSERADEVWKAVALADTGPDLIYRFAESHGTSSLGKRASKLLSDSAVQANASDAVNIAFELREGACDKKLSLLDRAVEEGDQRAELVIDVLVRACVKNQKAIDSTLKKMRKKRGKE